MKTTTLRVDLHTHTTVSDGALTPRELVRAAKNARLDIIAITDHDATDALDEAVAEGLALGLKIIPGIELSTHAPLEIPRVESLSTTYGGDIQDKRFLTGHAHGFEIHILGYNINYKSGQFQKR